MQVIVVPARLAGNRAYGTRLPDVNDRGRKDGAMTSSPTVDGAAGAAPTIRAIRTAAARTGVDFAFMLAQAAMESGFDPRAQAATSSARGLYQFTDATWLAMVRDHGAEIGLGGRAVVKDRATRADILALRDDPRLSAELAARLAQDNRAALEGTLGAGKVGATELYLAHFLGAGQAIRFLIAMATRPETDAANLFPVEAKANPGVFRDDQGQARSLDQIYDRFARRIEAALDGTDTGSFAVAHSGEIGRPNPVTAPAAATWRPGHRYAAPLDPLVVLVLASLDAPAPAAAKRAVGTSADPAAS
jgi:hypothetical protein